MQKKQHITATIDNAVFEELEAYRENHKKPGLPDRSLIIQDAIVMYLKNKTKPKTI